MSATLGAITTAGTDGGKSLAALATAGYFGVGGSTNPNFPITYHGSGTVRATSTGSGQVRTTATGTGTVRGVD